MVSVVMPVYNAQAYVAAAIESILNQTYSHWELIIVNDASTDSSLEIIRSYQRHYPQKIRIISLPRRRNAGGDACANVGIAAARGEFIARMDADDIAHPERLARQLAFLQKHPKVIVVGSQAHIINAAGQITGEKLVPTTHAAIYASYSQFHPLIHPTVMLRRSLLPKRKNFYRIKYSANNDLYTFFELLNYGQFANLPDKLLYYRIHDGNNSLTMAKNRLANTLRIRLEAVCKFGYRPTLTGVVISLLQLLVALFVPEKQIVPLYYATRSHFTFSH